MDRINTNNTSASRTLHVDKSGNATFSNSSKPTSSSGSAVTYQNGRVVSGSAKSQTPSQTYTYKDRKGNQYTFDDDAVTWISKRYRNNAQNYYDSDNEDQANLANGLLPRSFQQSYKTKGDRQLYEMGMPSEKYLEGYLGEYQAWRDGGNGGAYYDVDSPNAKGMVDFIKSKWKSDWNYGKSTDDLLRQSKGEMPAAQAKLYMNSKTGMTNSWADEYYQSRGLPPASEMDYYVNAYNEYLTNTALKEDFYVDVGNRVLNYSVNDGIKNDDNVYDWKDADGKTVRKTGKQIWQDTYTSALAEEKYAPLLSVMPKPEKVTNSKDVEYVSIDDAVTAGALAVTAARPTEKDPWSYAPSYDKFVEQTNANDAALRADALLSRLTLSDAEQSALTMAGKNPDDMTVGDYLDYRQSEADKSYVEGMDFTPDAFDLFDQDYGPMPVTDRITFLAENGASKSEIKDYVKYEKANYGDEDIDFDSAQDAALAVAKESESGGFFSKLFGGKKNYSADEVDETASPENPAPVPADSAYTVEVPAKTAVEATKEDTNSYKDDEAFAEVQQEQSVDAEAEPEEYGKLDEKGLQEGTKAVQDKLSSVFNNALNSMYSDADKTPEGLEWLTASGFSMLNGGDPIEYGGDTTIYEKGVRQIVDNSLVYKDGVVPTNIMKSENVGRTVTKRKLTMTEDEAVEAGSNPDADVTGERTLSNGIKIKSLSGGKGFGSELDSDYAEQNTLGISSPEEEEPESFTSGGTWNYLDPEQKDKHYVDVKTDMVSYYDESGELNWVPYADLENGSVDNELSEDTIDGMLSAYEQTFGSDEGKTFKPSGTVTLADTYKTLDWFIKNRVNPEFVYDFFYKLAEDGVLLEDNDETYVDEHYDTLTAAWAEPSEQSVATLWDAARSKYQPYEKSVVQSVADSARKYYSDGSGYQDYLFHQALRKEGYGWTINKEDAARAYYCAVGILADAKASGNYTDEELSHINPEDAQNVWDSFSDEDRQSLYDSFSESYAYNRDLYHPDGERVARIVFDLIPRFGANTAAAGVGLIGTVASFIGRGEDVVNSDMYQNATKRQARYDTFTYGGVSSGKDKAVNIGGRVVDEVTRMYATGLAGQGVSAVTGAANKANVFAKAAEKVVVTGKAKNLVKKGVEFLGRLTAVSNVPMVASAIGSNFNQAVSEGADPNEMSTGVYATVTGVVEGVTESLNYDRWTNKAWGSDKLFKLIQNGSKSLTKGTANLFKFKVGAAAVCSEILEEYSSNFASWAMARATYDKDAALSDQDWAETTYMTALTTLLGKGIGGGTSVNQVVSNYMLDNGISTSLLDVMFADTQVAALREDVVADLTPNAALLSDEKFKSANNNIVNSARQINAENEAFNAKVAEYEGNIQSCLGELNAASEALTQADVNNPAEYTEAMERYTTAKAMYDEAVAYTESTDFMSLAKMHEEKIAQYKQASDKSTAALNGHFIAMHNMFSGYLSPFTIIDETKTSIEEHAALMAQTATLLSQQNLSVDELAQLDEFNDRMVALNTKIDQGSAVIANSSKYIAELEARIAQAKATGASVAKLAAEAKVESEKAAGQTTIGDALKAKGIEIAPTLDQEEALSLLQNGVVYAMGNDPALFNECEDAIAKLNAGKNVDSTLIKLANLGVKADANYTENTSNIGLEEETTPKAEAEPAVAEDVPTVAEDVSGEESNPTTAEEAAEAFTAEEDVEAPAPAEQLGPQTVETTNEDSNYKDQSKAWKKLSPNESVVTLNKAQMDRCSKMAEAIGAKIAWDETRANGRYENGVIHLNPNQIIDVHGKGLNAKSMPVEMLVFKHEMTHYLEALDQSEFNGLLDMMMDYDKSKYGEQQFEAKWNAFSARVKQSRAEMYDGTPEQFENFWINNGDAIVRSEYSAIFAAENLFTDMKSIQYFVDHQQKTASKVSLLVQNLIHNKLGIGNDSRTYNVSASMQKQLTKIEQRYLQAFANAGKHNTDAVREYQMSTWDAAEALHKMQPKIERKLLSGIKLNNKASLSGYVGDIVELLSNGDTSVLSVDSPAMNRLIDFLTANMYGENKNKVPAQDKELVKSVVKDIRNTVFSLDLGNGTLIRNAKENYPYLKRNFSTQKAGTYTKSGKKVASIDGFFADNFTDYYTGDLSIEDLPWNGATKSHPILGELPRGEDNQLEWLNAFIEEYGTRKNDAFNFGSTIVSGLDALEMNRDTFAEYVVSDFTEAISSNPRLASTLLTGEYSEEGIEKARQSVESKYWSNPIQEFINEGTADSEYGGDYGDVMGDTLFDTNESFSSPNVTPDLDAEYMSLAEKYSNGTISEDEENRLGEMVGRQAKERNAKLFDAYERTIGPLDLERLKVDPNRSDSDMKLPDLVTYDDNGNIIPLSKRFDAENPDVRYYTDISFDNVTPIEETRYADPMYYKSERVITALNLSKFDAPSLVKMLQGKGVKPDELKWLGLDQWLAGRKSVSKGELLQFISDSRATVQPTTEMDVAGNNVVNRLVSPDGSVVGRLVTSHATDGDGNPALYIGTADGSSAIQHAIRLAAEGGYDSVVFKTDSIKPKDVANFVKPWGTMASYEEITVGDSAIDGIGVKITDDMRESVLYEGQPLFDRGLTFGGNDESWSTMSLDARKKATSQFFDNTVEYVTDESSVKAVNDVLAALGVPGVTYERETEKQSIIKAREALNKDFDGEWKRLKTTSAPWTSVEMDEAMGILAACRKVADETGNVQQYYDWLRTTQRHVTANAQALQALAKYTRSTVEGWIVNGLHITENAFMNATPRQQSNVRKTQGAMMTAISEARTKGSSSSELSAMLKSKLGKVYADKVAKVYDDFNAGRLNEAQFNEAVEGLAKEKEGIANLSISSVNDMMDFQKEAAEHQKLYDSLKKQYDESTDDEERKELLKRMDEEDYLMRASNNRAAQVIANLEPGTFKEWASSWRRIAMLLNPKTMIKNAVANAVFAPLEWAKDVVATPFDILMSNRYGTQRTTTAGSIVEEYKGRIAGAKAAISDIKLGVDTKEGDGEKYEGGQRRVWTAGGKDNAFRRTMQNLDNLVSYGMQAGDRPYFEGALNNRLSQLKALGYDMDSAETRNDAIAYALDRTFQNNSKLANALSTLRTTLNLGMPVGIGDMILPFVQTPANIADKLLDYGPVGLFRAVVQLGQAHKQGTLDVDDNGNRIAKSTNKYSFDQKLFVDRIGRGLTGSALLALGFALSKCGLLTRKPDDEDERIMAQQAGVADYALKLGDVTVPINWAEPAGTTLLIGAAFEDVFDGDSSFLDGVRAFYLTGVNSFFDNSVLQNVTNLLGGNSTPGENVEDFVLGSATQFVPSLFKAIMNFFDPYERDTYDKNKFQRTLNKLMMYAPGLRQSLPVKVGTDGKIMESSYGDEPFERFVNSFIAPAIVKEKTNDRVNREIYRLYEAGYDGQVLPVANRTMTINSKKYTLTQTDQARLQKALGKACYDAIKDIMNSPEYKTLTNKEKAKLIHDTIYGENGNSGIKKDVLEEWNEIFSEYPRYNK